VKNLSIDRVKATNYISKVFKKKLYLKSIKKLGAGVLGEAYLIEVEINKEKKLLVLKTLNSKGFGQDFPADRADTLIYAHSVYNRLQNHVKSYDVGAIMENGSLTSMGNAEEFFILMDFVEGIPYAEDLDRIKKTGKSRTLDIERVTMLAEYEAKIHAVKRDDPALYVRRIRDLIGRGDCITGIIDTYPKDDRTYAFTSDDEFKRIEKKCIEWRWKIKDKTSRLCQVHGDIHPFNILWQDRKNFILLDRSRGEWGEAADDVSCLSINYIFWSLMAKNRFEGPFKFLFNTFIEKYLDITGDTEIFKVIQPFYAFRSLVIAHPLFYPNISLENRRCIFNFLNAILDVEEFNTREIDSYLKG
jgi:hypothetical protein